MNEDFIRISAFEGELKISHKKKDLGLSVSTKEMVLQKPHVNYHIKLDHIRSIVPFRTNGFSSLKFVNDRAANHEVTKVPVGAQHYKIAVQRAVMHNRSGIFDLGAMEFVMPVHEELLDAIAKYGNLNAIEV